MNTSYSRIVTYLVVIAMDDVVVVATAAAAVAVVVAFLNEFIGGHPTNLLSQRWKRVARKTGKVQ